MTAARKRSPIHGAKFAMPEFTGPMLRAAQNGDRQALANLVRAWHRPLRAFVAALMLGSRDADDVAQEVFLRAIERLDCVSNVETVGAFLRGIARNIVREHTRKQAREYQAYLRFIEIRFRADAGDEESSWVNDPDLLAALRACLAALPDRSRTMLALRYDDELTSDQIGQRFGVNGPAVRTEMRRARVALLECIQAKQTPAWQGS